MAKNVTKTKEKKKGNKFTRWVGSIFAELKKVTWPSFPTVLKQTAVVLGVTAIFLVVLLVIDGGLSVAYGQLRELLNESSAAAAMLGFIG